MKLASSGPNVKYELRPYQEEAVKKIMWSRDTGLLGAEVLVLPTGAGKSIVIAELAHRINAPILILQPTKEILEQNVEKMRAYVDDEEIGIYSASVGRKDLSTYTFATIQSVYKFPKKFEHFNYIIIDECHQVNPKDRNSMYVSFVHDLKDPKVIGLTATPYRLAQRYERLKNGGILTHTVTKLINRTQGWFWKRIVFNMNCAELMEQGFLQPLDYIDRPVIKAEDIPVNKSKSEYNLLAFEAKIVTKRDEILATLKYAEEVGKHVLVFCSSIAQAESFSLLTPRSRVVTSKTPKKEREELILDFREGRIQTVFNVGVLTTGFDFPELDCIVLLRPTRSLALYYQMLGRGVRIAEGKENCKVIDLTDTVKTLGKIETIKMVKRNMWELESETKENWHNVPLYSFMLEPRG